VDRQAVRGGNRADVRRRSGVEDRELDRLAAASRFVEGRAEERLGLRQLGPEQLAEERVRSAKSPRADGRHAVLVVEHEVVGKGCEVLWRFLWCAWRAQWERPPSSTRNEACARTRRIADSCRSRAAIISASDWRSPSSVRVFSWWTSSQ
jgi:hypothetical protein